ncbi:hypothetical protein IIA29_12955 [candidate division KSB1 bacterium]|nr:hypothetical protein [candidate division KSB1 bacterium]
MSPQAPDFFNEGGKARLLYSARNGFSRHERNLQRRGRLFNPILVYKGDKGFFYWPETNELHTFINVKLLKGLFNFRFTNPSRLIPHLNLQMALKQAATLRSLAKRSSALVKR